MRGPRRQRKVGLTGIVTFIFVLATMVPNLAQPAFAAPASAPPSQAPQPTAVGIGAASSAVPEDPLGQQPEQQTPEISVDVDVRDGHLVARVVDVWGPGRAPFVVRSYTNASALDTSAAGNWHLNRLLDWADGVREPDGNRSYYNTLLSSQVVGTWDRYDVYAKTVGAYSTVQLHYTCRPVTDEIGRTSCSGIWDWDGLAPISLSKGVTRRFRANPGVDGSLPSLIDQEQDASGNTTTFARSSLFNQAHAYVATETDAVGRVTAYGYEQASSTVICFTSETGVTRCTTYWYYRVISVTDPYGRVATYTYDASNHVIAARNGAGQTTQYGYNGGLLTTITDARGATTTIVWTCAPCTPTPTNRVSQVIAPDLSSTTYAYPLNGPGRTVVTDARGNQTTYEMDGAGNILRRTDPLNALTQYTYDGNQNVTQVTDARGNLTTFAYNGRNKVTQIVKAAGVGALNLTATLAWDNNDNLLSVTNPRGIRTNYTYDPQNRITQVRRAVATSDESLTQYTYTPWGGVASAIDPRGNTTTFSYTARRQVQTVTPPAGGPTQFGYDAFDDLVTRTDGNLRNWTTTYNASRQSTSATDPLGNRIQYQYDAGGNRIRTIDPKLQATVFTYDTRGRLTAITDALNQVTRYEYDAVSNLTKLVNARNAATTLAYDQVNRLIRVTDALNQSTTSGYDPAGNRTSMIDRKAQAFAYTYDQVNRLTQLSVGTSTIGYTYDANGNGLTMADGTGTTAYTYDNLDRRTQTTYPDGKTVQTGYDAAGNRTSLTNPGAIATQATYDAANRLIQLTQGVLSWTFAYDGAGNRTLLTQPNGTNTTYAYQTNNWLSLISHQGPAGGIQSVSYTYDANGNRLSQSDSTGTTGNTYDALNRLTQGVYPGTYGTWSWTYDATGNRIQQVAPGGITAYAYDANNRLTQAGAATYTYDANGNVTASSTGQTFSYNAFNQLIQATGPGGTATYTYNGAGLKLQRADPKGVTRYYYDGIRPVWETDGVGAMTAQLDRDIFGNLLSRRDATGSRRYYHPDGLGSTVALTDETGKLTDSMLYDAWGNLRASSGTAPGKYQFTGAELDFTTGLYHMGARFYDPTGGRWLSEDPVQSSGLGGLNLYAYVGNNPLAYADPSGTCDQECLERLNQERLELAKKARDTTDYVAARELARTLESIVGNEKAQEAALKFLDKVQAGTDPSQALVETLTETAPTQEEIRKLYTSGVAAFTIGAILVGGGVALAVKGAFGPGAAIAAWGGFLLRRGGLQIIDARALDREYYGGQVFESLDIVTRGFIRAIFGGP